MSETISADFTTLLRQASLTGEEYMEKAHREVFSKDGRYSDLTQVQKTQVMIEMAKLASADFNAAVLTVGLQHIAEAIRTVGDVLDAHFHGDEQ